MEIEGTLIDVEAKSGNFTPEGSTESRAWANVLVHVLVGRRVVKVKFKGDDQHLGLSLRDKIGQKVKVGILLPERVDALPTSH